MLDPAKFPLWGDDEEAIRRTYGEPEAFVTDHGADERDPERAWREKILSRPVRFPSAVNYGTSRTLMTKLCVHKLIEENVARIFETLASRNLWRWITDCGGAYALRSVRGGTRLSAHSWAAAIDFNTARYPLGKPADYKDAFVVKVVPVFEEAGWVWGGRWARPDVQHFQAIREDA
jgi:hypothetical protein